MTSDELKTLLATELMGLASRYESDDYDNAIDAAERDTGWTMPVTDSFQIKWMIERSKRALFAMRLHASADKFKYDRASINQRFDHFFKLVQMMDKEFLDAKAEDPAAFAGVDDFHLFGTKIDAGFAYEAQSNREMTYADDNLVVFAPDESD